MAVCLCCAEIAWSINLKYLRCGPLSLLTVHLQKIEFFQSNPFIQQMKELNWNTKRFRLDQLQNAFSTFFLFDNYIPLQSPCVLYPKHTIVAKYILTLSFTYMYLLNTYHMPGSEDIAVNKTKSLLSWSLHFPEFTFLKHMHTTENMLRKQAYLICKRI